MGKADTRQSSDLFRAGEPVKVKTKDEISKTLDPLGRSDGCLYMSEMWEACGKEFLVLKEIRNFFDERRCKMYKPRRPLYLLKGSICSGEVDEQGHRCDHSCHFLWHEHWLEPLR